MITMKMLYEAYVQAYGEVIQTGYAQVGVPVPRVVTWQELQIPSHELERQAYRRMAELLNSQLGLWGQSWNLS